MGSAASTALRDRCPSVRRAACQTLHALGGYGARQLAATIAGHTEEGQYERGPRKRVEAGLALGVLGPTLAAPHGDALAVVATHDPCRQVRMAALEALDVLGSSAPLNATGHVERWRYLNRRCKS